jgi:hypothetical protein
MMPLEDVRCISTSSAPTQRPARGQRRDEEIGLGSCRPPAFLPWRRVKKPGAPGVTEGKGKERGTGPFDAPIVQAQGYTLITARQELGNRALPGRGPTGPRFFHRVAAQGLALEGDANSRPSGYENKANYQKAPSRVAVGGDSLSRKGGAGGGQDR